MGCSTRLCGRTPICRQHWQGWAKLFLASADNAEENRGKAQIGAQGDILAQEF